MQRVLTALVAIPVVVLLIKYSPDWLFALAIGVVSAAAADEFLELAAKKGIGRPGRWFIAMAAFVTMSFNGGGYSLPMTLAVTTIVLMTATIFSPPIETALGRVGMGLGAIGYCGVTLGFVVMMPRDLIFVLLAIIWAGDTAAYYGGRALGRHLLAPRVSPKKTIEGAVAGLLASVIAGTVGGVWYLGEPSSRWLTFAVLSLVTAIAGQAGDLAESVLKRSASVKDSSSVLPGHGGILDRLDSLFFAAPVFYWFFKA